MTGEHGHQVPADAPLGTTPDAGSASSCRTGPDCLGRIAGQLAPIAAAAAYLVLVLIFSNFRDVFEFDMDEGNNVIKALLVERGYGLYSEIWSDQPPLFTWMLTGCFRLFGWDVNVARVLVLLFASGIVFALYDSLRITWGHAAALVAVALLPCSKYFVTLSVSTMLGLPAISLAVLGLWALLRWRASGRAPWLIVAGVLMGLSWATKLFTAFLLPVFAVWIVLVDAGRGRSPRWPRALAWSAGWSLCAVLIPAIILLLAAAPAYWGPLYSTHADARTAGVYGQGAPVGQLLGNLRDDWQIMLLAAMGVIHVVLRKRYGLLIVPAWILVALAALWRHAPVWYHHHLLVSVPACAIAGIAVGQIASGGFRTQRGWDWIVAALLRVAAVVAAAALGWAVISGAKRPAGWPWLSWRDHDRFVVQVMKAYQHATDVVVVDRQMYAFRAGYAVPPNLSVTSHKRLATGNLTDQEILRTIAEQKPQQIVLSWRFSDQLKRRIRDAIRERYTLVYHGVQVYLDDRQVPVEVYVRTDIAGDPLDVLSTALQSVPNVAAAHDYVGLLSAARGDTQQAVAAFRRAYQLDPTDPRACRHLAESRMSRGDWQEGFAVFKAAMKQPPGPRRDAVARACAWRRATCPDAAYRSGAEAEGIIRSILQTRGQQHPGDMETLAVALAGQSRFDQALTIAQRALALARAGDQQTAAGRLQQQIESYRRHQPWTEAVALPSP
ncbi:MAG TPA: glycosyltransferase family 39 protein [Phycisphaerae bacterium]|nr:glycosyltransferase family 39 protein [Phycisphaerae bacterium]